VVETTGIYAHLVWSRIRSQAQYRLSLALFVLGQVVVALIDFLEIVVIFENVPALAGWTLAEVAFLYGVAELSLKVADTLVGNVELLPDMIRTGELDTVLVRPLGSLFQVLTGDFGLHRLGGAAQAGAIFVFALTRLHIAWTPGRIAMVPVMFCSGIAIFCGIWIATNSIAFWLIDSREVANSTTYGGGFLASYPLPIFGKWLRRFLGFFIPVAFVSYFPALYVLGKPGWPLLRFASPVVALVSVIVARLVWRAAVRRYRSTGS
jgi:ABC-2 type transport system permease protein